jgi:Ca-activated chloride channel family protein
MPGGPEVPAVGGRTSQKGAPMPSPELEAQTQELRIPKLVSVDGRTYPLQSAQIKTRAEGGLASTTLVQEFANPYDDPLEVIYTMPLPADGAVLGYTIRMGEKVIRGEIEPREKAEAMYKKALSEGRTAGLLEQDRTDTFMQRLGNLPPRTNATVEIEILQPLAFLAGTGANESGNAGPVWEYRFPTVVSARYEGEPGRVTDAERIDVDRDEDGGVPTRLGLSLTIADHIAALDTIASPSHEIVCISDANGTSVRFAGKSRLDRDLVIQWPAATDEVGVRVVEGRGLAGDDGRYALVTITPPRVTRAAYHRDLTVLIDASGSMGGPPLEIAKRVVSDLLRSLEPGDRFEVLEFANDTRRVTRGVEEATPKAIERCLRAICAICAGGGTEMAQAVEKALAPLRKDSQRQVVLVSDGQIGFESEIFAKMGHRLPAGVRVHAVGIGSAPNRALMSGVARAGRGIELIAGDEASAAGAARRLCAATVRPVLTNLTISGSAVCAAAPERPRDVFAGQPIVLAAELRAEGGVLEVSASLAGSEEVWAWRMDVPKMGTGVAPSAESMESSATEVCTTPLPIGALYGREAIADAEMGLMGIEPRGADQDLDDTVEALGMRHRITSRRTSLVAIAEEPSVDPLKPLRRERLAVELPAGVSAEGVGLWGRSDLARSIVGFMSLSKVGQGFETEALYQLADVPRAFTGKDTAHIGGATVVHIDGPEIVIEFLAPFDGFYLPVGEVIVYGVGKAMVLGEKSSPQGPHEKESVLRLTLRLEEGKTWPESDRVELRWGVPPELLGATEFSLTVEVRNAPDPAP